MIEKKEEVEKTIISGHLFLNKEDKKTVKGDLQKLFFRKGSERQRKQQKKETNNKKG